MENNYNENINTHLMSQKILRQFKIEEVFFINFKGKPRAMPVVQERL